MITECPHCKSKNIALIETSSNSKMLALATIDTETKKVNPNEFFPIYAFVCKDCKLMYFSPKVENNN